jgi:NAD(P)-dependent dehydrogenase (short-subunit alcohol dehydrogenase family)
MPLRGKSAIVTGAAQGIGREIALELARQGCTVVLADLKDAAETAAAVAQLGGHFLTFRSDVSKADEVDGLIAAVCGAFGRLDILVNNAGTQTWKPLLELAEEDWDRTLAVNLKGTFLCTQRAARWMKDHGGGRIVNLGSGCNKLAFPNLVDYTASRGGVEMFTKAAAIELGQYGITVNCVAPGAIETERTKLEVADYAGSWSALTPLGRIGRPLDVARVVAALCGDAGEFVTGQTIWVDGGLFSRAPWVDGK